MNFYTTSSPLEQFEIFYFFDPTKFVITNVHIFLSYVILLYIFYFIFVTKSRFFSHQNILLISLINLLY